MVNCAIGVSMSSHEDDNFSEEEKNKQTRDFFHKGCYWDFKLLLLQKAPITNQLFNAML